MILLTDILILDSFAIVNNSCMVQVVSTLAFHAGDPGSSPGTGSFLISYRYKFRFHRIQNLFDPSILLLKEMVRCDPNTSITSPFKSYNVVFCRNYQIQITLQQGDPMYHEINNKCASEQECIVYESCSKGGVLRLDLNES